MLKIINLLNKSGDVNMLRVVLLISILISPFKTFAICNSDDTFDATATVEIPKPKNFFSGTPKPTPETIENGISIAKQKVLQKYIGKCITERSKLDQYLKNHK